MIQLENTERCNLRCAYCLYGRHYRYKRNHGTRDMRFDYAEMAFDHLAKSSRNKSDAAVTSYGGEPLLKVPFIISCVAYSRKRLKEKDLRFSLTTNAILIEPTTAMHLANENICIHISTYGPQEVHDQHRVDKGNVGSFQRTISGLKNLFDAYGDKSNLITLSMVYASLYSIERKERVATLWDLHSWLPRDIRMSISYTQSFFPPGIAAGEKPDDSLFEWAKNRYIDDYRGDRPHHPISSSIMDKEMVRIVQRPEYSAPVQTHNLNGCCVPGAREQFVPVDGTILLCERVDSGCSIGNFKTSLSKRPIKSACQ